MARLIIDFATENKTTTIERVEGEFNVEIVIGTTFERQEQVRDTQETERVQMLPWMVRNRSQAAIRAELRVTGWQDGELIGEGEDTIYTVEPGTLCSDSARIDTWKQPTRLLGQIVVKAESS